jgi:tRNA dimethylallyltransferase
VTAAASIRQGRPRRCAVLLMGPTGSGKTDLALRLIDSLPLEIVSVDSALVYRGMDIGTAKPSLAVRARVPHHLIDIRDPSSGYSAGEFLRDAQLAMDDIWARGRHPLLVGGTMLYFEALTAGLAELPEADPAVRAGIAALASKLGWAAVHRELAAVDPAAGLRIHVNDPQRIQRALEVFRITGATITELQQKRLSVFADVNVIEIAIAPLERAELHTKIALRFERMLADGFLEEVRNLFLRADLSAEHPSMRAVGYRQLWQHLTGEISLNEASTRAIAATRQLAKRQLTWLRRRSHARCFDAMHPDVARAILDALSKCEFTKLSSV